MMMQSPLMDTRRYVAEIEQAYRQMLEEKGEEHVNGHDD